MIGETMKIREIPQVLIESLAVASDQEACDTCGYQAPAGRMAKCGFRRDKCAVPIGLYD